MKVRWTCYAHLFTSMGIIANNVIRELDSAGVETEYKILNDDYNILEYPIEVQKAMKTKLDPNESIEIMFSYPDSYGSMDSKIKIGYTGMDTSGGYKTLNPRDPWKIMCNQCDYMLTPSEYSRQFMINAGVTKDIFLYPHGINFDVFKPMQRVRSTPFTFLYLGEMTHRKGVQSLIKAFIKTYGDNPNYKLILRGNTHMYYYGGDEIRELCSKVNNIQCDWKDDGQNDVIQYYNAAHVYIHPSKADWFGMPVLEALSTGCPTVATATNGYYEFLNRDADGASLSSIGYIPLAYSTEDIGDKHPYLLGKWNNVTEEEICRGLKFADGNHEYLARRAYEHSVNMKDNWSWKVVSEKYLLPILEKIDKKHFTVEKKKPVKETLMENSEKLVCVGIPTKDRLVEICVLLQSLVTQTFTDFDIIIVNDCRSDCLSNPTFQSICDVLRVAGHDVKIIPGPSKGPQYGGQIIFENAKSPYILRLDDDVSLAPNFIEELINVITSDSQIAAVGPCYISPNGSNAFQKIDPTYPREYIEHLGKVFWAENELFLTGYLQTVEHPKGTPPIPVEHLNSGFMYRRECMEKIGGYYLDLSIAGHREESDISFRMFKLLGMKEYIVTSAVAHHYHPMSGGIRETQGNFHSKENWDHDEKIFLERMETWMPKPQILIEDRFVSVLILSSGDHASLDELLSGIVTYTNHPAEYIIGNNDISEFSKRKFTELATKYKNANFRFYQYHKELSVSEARNTLVDLSSLNSKFICFLDDDVKILGRYNQTTDWLDYLWNRFQEIERKFPCGAISPILTWLEELQCHCVSVACLLTSKKVWNIVGGFDPIFGNKDRGTWGWEDSDWSYRCESAGFKLGGVIGNECPVYHPDTTGKEKPLWREQGLLRGKQLLLDKHKVDKINELCRTIYPFTYEQMSRKGTKLNLGCNYMKLDDFINVDINPAVKPDMVLDITKLDEKFVPNSIDLILLSQTLEHVDEKTGIEVLEKIYKCLMPGGCVIVEVPDGDDIEEKFQNGKINEHQYNVLKGGNPAVEYQDHQALYSRKKLEAILLSIGFKEIRHLPLEMTSDQWEAIRIDAIK